MTIPDDPFAIFDRIVSGKSTESDLETIRQLLTLSDTQGVVQFGKYNVNLSRGQGDIHIGDRIYQGASAEAIRDIIQSLLQKLQVAAQPNIPPLKSVDELVQQVRSRLHDDIQRLHGTMPLWGVDHWVPLGELFVDVNILEELSSSRRSELADLWQDFSQNPSYRSLDRIGLGRERQRVSGLEVLEKHTNLMVVGKPGSGKTTYLQRVVTECNAGNLQAHKIPVLIRLREFVEDGRDIAYSLERYLERCWQLAAAEIQLVLNQGRSLLMLDGLDEVTGEDGKTITKQIKQFARAYPQVQMIVTCRTQSQESRFERFDSVEVADFNEPQVRAFTEHWFQTVCTDQGAGQAKAQVFLDQLFQEENKPIRELAITPILLSLTCAVFQQKQAFYSKRSRLYEEGLELLLEQWDKSREIERDELYRNLSLERKLELLSYLAVKKFEQEQYVLFEQTELEGYIAEFLGIGLRESRGVLRAIESQHGLLIERSHRIWSFSHLTFQEYLVACIIEEENNLSNHVTERHWNNVFLLLVEMSDEANTILKLIKDQADYILVETQEFQNLLSQIHCRVHLINFSCKPTLVRGLYFYLYYFNHVHDCSLAIRFSNKIQPGFLLEILEFAEQDRATDFVLGINNSVAFNIAFVMCLTYFFDRELHCLLKPTMNQVMDFFEDSFNDDREKIWRSWLINSGRDWIDLFKTIIMNYYDSKYGLKRIELEDKRIVEYYAASVLVLDALEVAYSVTDEIKQRIEDSLMLPIAEIEKRKCKKAE